MLRRLQLAAEDQGTWVVLFRPASATRHRSPAALRLRVSQAQAATRVEILKCRGGRPGVVDLASGALDAGLDIERLDIDDSAAGACG